jgi:hypothetical protein
MTKGNSKAYLNADPDKLFQTEREEPLLALINLRIAPSQKEKLRAIPKWQEKVREAIASLIEREERT